MKLRFWVGQPSNYSIESEIINGIDLSEIMEGESFELPEMIEAGILKAHRSAGELFVELEQQATSYHLPVDSHDWRESDWIDSSVYEQNTCYLKPIAVEGRLDWRFELTGRGWTVVRK